MQHFGGIPSVRLVPSDWLTEVVPTADWLNELPHLLHYLRPFAITCRCPYIVLDAIVVDDHKAILGSPKGEHIVAASSFRPSV